MYPRILRLENFDSHWPREDIFETTRGKQILWFCYQSSLSSYHLNKHAKKVAYKIQVENS